MVNKEMRKCVRCAVEYIPKRNNQTSCGNRTCAGYAYAQKHREKIRSHVRLWRTKNRDRINNYAVAYRRERRLETLRHYSGGIPKCACCGETETAFLCMDHINGGGLQHRREITGGDGNGVDLPMWLLRNGFPDGFQVLCFNCNCAKHKVGICPHRLKDEYNRKDSLNERSIESRLYQTRD